MIGIYAFGQHSIPISPHLFAAMPPVMQTLAVRHMADIGMPAAFIRWATGLNQRQFDEIAQMHHCVPAAGLIADEASAKAKAGREPGRLYPVNAEKALLWLCSEGGRVRISFKGLEASAALARGSGREALGWLLDRGYLGILGDQRNNAASTYQVTRPGWRLARALEKAGAP
ncbi:hypothetical protein IFT84_20445 [Rhizobium sp. CFBP 8762]|uniref:hypothetical protein n=1 Tax=Rhizobium sp. CFBP 8762 TaxID=2775279 RepID=UPI0017847EC8|nr:hypothetical protein [Rhizobium sp. CFBP 8762]MBD8556883.1 hypothetical protein [Rhizobium sp. CFBP 8762]